MKAQDDESLDPRLREALNLLRPTPRRDMLAAARAKAAFLAELEGLFEADPPTTQSGFFADPAGWLERFKKTLVSFNAVPRSALSFSALLLIVVVLLFGWAGITAKAAETSLPGDRLYSFKTGIEQMQVALAGDLDKQAGLYIEFASHRLQELEQLVDKGRYQKAVELSAKFRLNIQKALDITNRLAKVNPARGAQRRIEIDTQQALFTAQLDQLLVKIPAPYQPAFNYHEPPILPGTPSPVAPTLTGTPALTGEPNVPQSGNPTNLNKLEDGSDAEYHQGSDGNTVNESSAGETSTEDAGGSGQQGSEGDTELENDPGSEQVGSSESEDSGQNEQVEGSHDDEHDPENHADEPSETQAANPAPAPVQH